MTERSFGTLSAMGRFVITMSAVSYARELWRFGEPELAERASGMAPDECAAVGERAGQIHADALAEELWPVGPRGFASATMLSVIERLEGRPRPCARARRLPERSLPDQWRLSEAQRWGEIAPVSNAMDARLHATD